MTTLRVAVLGFLVVMVAAAPAEARRGRGGIVIINLGDDIMPVRQTSAEQATNEDGSAATLDQIGYHYQRFGLFWMDVWRWGGEWVLYTSDGTSYAPISDAELEQLGGARFPIAYHLPPGFLLLLCGGYFAIARRKNRTVKFALIAGGVFLGLAAILFLLGLGLGSMIPGFLGLYHLFAAKFSPAGSSFDDDTEAPVENDYDAAPAPAPLPPASRSTAARRDRSVPRTTSAGADRPRASEPADRRADRGRSERRSAEAPDLTPELRCVDPA